jgi:hypothetical protein
MNEWRREYGENMEEYPAFYIHVIVCENELSLYMQLTPSIGQFKHVIIL